MTAGGHFERRCDLDCITREKACPHRDCPAPATDQGHFERQETCMTTEGTTIALSIGTVRQPEQEPAGGEPS